jgi:ArsR family transcriptional regulator
LEGQVGDGGPRPPSTFRLGSGNDSRSTVAATVARPTGREAMSNHEAKQLETVFKTLADRRRLKILNRLLAAGDAAVCVCDLEAVLHLKQPTISYHLKQLLEAGIVDREKRG